MIVAKVIRRFKVNGALRELARIMECPAIPPKGTVLDFNDGSGESAVAFLRLVLRDVEFRSGFMPTAVVIHTESESADRLPKAEAAGWKAVE